MSYLTQAELKLLLHYDPTTGLFTRLVGKGKGAAVGDVAGAITPQGYRSISVKCRRFMAHRLAWLYMTGVWPTTLVDHADQDKDNNTWLNLREATKSQNAGNTKKHCDNSTGFKGVRKLWNGSFQAILFKDGKQHSLGTFKEPSAAHAAYLNAAQEHFKEFAHDGT